MSDSSDSSDETPARTKAGEIIDKSTKLGKLVTGLRPDQVLTVVAITSLFFVCGMYTWQSYLSDKRSNDALAMLIRSGEAREEVQRRDRVSSDEAQRRDCAAMEEKRTAATAALVKDIHAANAAERKERMAFEASEIAKLTAAITMMGMRLSDVERAVKVGGP